MSVRDDLVNRARESTVVAAERAGRQAVIATLERFDARNVSGLSFVDIVMYIEAIEKLEAPTVQLPVKFVIGDNVVVGPGDLPGVVVGYEIRYKVANKFSANPVFGHRAERIKAAPHADQWTPNVIVPSKYV